MSVLKIVPATETLPRITGRSDSKAINLVSLLVEEDSETRLPAKLRPALPSRVAVPGNYLPRQCGIATFTADLCEAISAEFGATELLELPVNAGYRYDSARLQNSLRARRDWWFFWIFGTNVATTSQRSMTVVSFCRVRGSAENKRSRTLEVWASRPLHDGSSRRMETTAPDTAA
jgi:hypothetical protein